MLIGKRAAEMLKHEIDAAVYRDARPGELRGLTDAFDADGIAAIAANPCAGSWRYAAALLLDGEG